MRSAVERFFAHLQSAAIAGFDQGRFCVRGLAKVSVITAIFVIATNLRLLHSAAKKVATTIEKKINKSINQPRTYNGHDVSFGAIRGEKRSIATLLGS